MTADELRSIAGEAGFGAQAVERAIAEAHQAAAHTEVRQWQVEKSGIVITRLSTTRAIPIQISSEQLATAVRLFHPYREGLAQVNLEEHQITWRDRKGLGFMVTSARGVTEVGVFVSKPLIRKGLWMGWVRTAADRLEALVLLVAARDPEGTKALGTPHPAAVSTEAGPEHQLR